MASLGYRVVRCNTFADILRVLLGLASLSLLLVVWKKNADAWWDDEYNTYVIGGNAAACGVSVLRLLLGPLSARDYLRYGSVTLLFTALEAAIISIVLFFICQGDSPVVDCFRDPVDDLCIFVVRYMPGFLIGPLLTLKLDLDSALF